MWLSELEKDMTVWIYGIPDYWNVYQCIVVGWSGTHAYLRLKDRSAIGLTSQLTISISSISTKPLESRQPPEGMFMVPERLH